ncbi:hypothetical protein SKAU_G00383250 [Synaphobranchus kaupii]|uniref:Uncharacterized protein n=1 Tax=Synaphobranchus kaupii TaxID=118154 RepID=A0A9Q1EE51_SYNKA|nr:hypothetical protein SKAU_G00383250 [Synaphobranchus kaupii]
MLRSEAEALTRFGKVRSRKNAPRGSDSSPSSSPGQGKAAAATSSEPPLRASSREVETSRRPDISPRTSFLGMRKNGFLRCDPSWRSPAGARSSGHLRLWGIYELPPSKLAEAVVEGGGCQNEAQRNSDRTKTLTQTAVRRIQQREKLLDDLGINGGPGMRSC